MRHSFVLLDAAPKGGDLRRHVCGDAEAGVAAGVEVLAHHRPNARHHIRRVEAPVRPQHDGRAAVLRRVGHARIDQQLVARDAQHREVGRQRRRDLPGQVSGAPRFKRIGIVYADKKLGVVHRMAT